MKTKTKDKAGPSGNDEPAIFNEVVVGDLLAMIDLGVGHLLAKNPSPICKPVKPFCSKRHKQSRNHSREKKNQRPHPTYFQVPRTGSLQRRSGIQFSSESQVYMVFDVKLPTSPCFLTVATRSVIGHGHGQRALQNNVCRPFRLPKLILAS